MKRDLQGMTGQRASSACKWLIHEAVGARELQQAGRLLQSRSKTLQMACREVFLPFTWIAGVAMQEAGSHKRGIAG